MPNAAARRLRGDCGAQAREERLRTAAGREAEGCINQVHGVFVGVKRAAVQQTLECNRQRRTASGRVVCRDACGEQQRLTCSRTCCVQHRQSIQCFISPESAGVRSGRRRSGEAFSRVAAPQDLQSPGARTWRVTLWCVHMMGGSPGHYRADLDSSFLCGQTWAVACGAAAATLPCECHNCHHHTPQSSEHQLTRRALHKCFPAQQQPPATAQQLLGG